MGLRRKHQRVYDSIYENPLRSSIDWVDIEALFEALGAQVSLRKGSRVAVALGGRVAVFHRPHEKEAYKGLILDVRRFLTEAGADKIIESLDGELDEETDQLEAFEALERNLETHNNLWITIVDLLTKQEWNFTFLDSGRKARLEKGKQRIEFTIPQQEETFAELLSIIHNFLEKQ